MVGTGRDCRDRAVFDVAGVPIAVEACDASRASLGATLLAGSPPTGREPIATFVIDDRTATAPADPPREEHAGIRLWEHAGGITVAARDAVGTVNGSRISFHVPRLEHADAVETMAHVLLGWMLAARSRFVVHGGAVARAHDALLVLGNSGAGKSTLVAAALEHEWRALSDDLVVLEADDDLLRVHGLHRAPAVPIEIGGPVVDMGAPLDDLRGRTALSRDLLTAGGFRLIGTVVATHAAGADGELRPAGPLEVLPLLMQSFAGMIDPEQRTRFFAFTERVRALPAWTLAHAGEPGARRAHVGAALARIHADAVGP